MLKKDAAFYKHTCQNKNQSCTPCKAAEPEIHQRAVGDEAGYTPTPEPDLLDDFAYTQGLANPGSIQPQSPIL